MCVVEKLLQSNNIPLWFTHTIVNYCIELVNECTWKMTNSNRLCDCNHWCVCNLTYLYTKKTFFHIVFLHDEINIIATEITGYAQFPFIHPLLLQFIIFSSLKCQSFVLPTCGLCCPFDYFVSKRMNCCHIWQLTTLVSLGMRYDNPVEKEYHQSHAYPILNNCVD